MLSSQFFKRYVSLFILVEMEGSFAQFTVNEMTEMCSQAPSFESDHSEISDQIRSQNKILENLAESIQTVQTQMENLSREVESKLETVQLGYSELKSQIEQLENLTTNCSTVRTTEVFFMFFNPTSLMTLSNNFNQKSSKRMSSVVTSFNKLAYLWFRKE